MGDLLKDFNIDSFREGNRFEAKLAKGGFPKSLWETYSSFANTDGGLILLGVKETRDHSFIIEGVEKPDLFIKNIWDTLNNPNKVSINLLLNKHVYAKEIRRYVDKFVFENPGDFRISLREAFNGGNSDPRNATILKMFSMIEIGERAGSGIPGIVDVWKKIFNTKPIYVQRFNPSRVITKLDISGYVSPAKIPSDKVNLQAIRAVSSDILSDKTSDNNDFQAINIISSDKTNQKQSCVEKALLDICEDGREHTVSEFAEILRLSLPRTRAIVSDLVSQKRLTAKGANKNRTYKLSPINKGN